MSEHEGTRAARTLQDYRAALDASAIVAITDLDGVITHANDRFCEVSGYSREELVGETHRLVKSDRHDAAFFAALWETIAAGRTWRGRVCNRRRDGTDYWLDTTITPLDGDGAVRAYLAIRHDVTPLVEALGALEASEGRFRALFDCVGVGIALVDLDDRIVEASPLLREMLGYDADEIIVRPFTSHAHPDDAHQDHDLFADLVAGTRGRYEIDKRYVRRDGTQFWGHTTVSIIHGADESPAYVIGVVRDVTEKRAADERAREQEALARLGEMAAVVAHEVRNPLAGIQGAVEVIGRSLAVDSPERGVVATIVERIGGLNDLVSQLLTFARPAELRISQVSVRDLLERVASLISGDPSLGGGRLAISGENATIEADPELLERALLNLALNAAQAACDAGAVEIEIRQTEDGCAVDFLDRGPGVDGHLRERIFEPFFTTKSRGAGLGLANARQVIGAHGGTLRVREREGGGACFELRLPKTRVSALLSEGSRRL